MEGVGVLHDEFPTAHQPETRPDLVAEFGLNLIKRDGQLFVGAQQLPSELRDDFLMGGAKAHASALAILQVEHDALASGVALPSTAAFPWFGGLELGKQRLKCTEAVKLVTNNRADFAQHPPHQGEVGIDAWSNASDVTTSNKQLMRRDFSVSGYVP